MRSSSSNLQTGWAFRVATVAGIPIRIHFTFVLILVWVAVSDEQAGANMVLRFLFLFLLFTCVVLHELGHALMARRFGVETLEIVLYPIGGIARLKSMPSGKAELLIAIAGPAVNVAIVAMLFPAVVLWLPEIIRSAEITGIPQLVVLVFFANIMLFLFNLIPAFPMDGGRILRSGLTVLGMPEDRATNIAAGIGQAIAVVFALLGLFTRASWGLLLIALFVFLGASQEAAFVRRRFMVRGRSAREAMITRFDTMAPQDTLRQAAELLLDSHQQDFPVIDAWKRVVGLLSRSAILEGLAHHDPGSAVLNIMDRDIHAVAPESSMDDVLRMFQESDGKPLLVMSDGDLVGMVTLDNLAEFIELARRNAKRLGVKS
jgi:Zn-dependent protease